MLSSFNHMLSSYHVVVIWCCHHSIICCCHIMLSSYDVVVICCCRHSYDVVTCHHMLLSSFIWYCHLSSYVVVIIHMMLSSYHGSSLTPLYFSNCDTNHVYTDNKMWNYTWNKKTRISPILCRCSASMSQKHPWLCGGRRCRGTKELWNVLHQWVPIQTNWKISKLHKFLIEYFFFNWQTK